MKPRPVRCILFCICISFRSIQSQNRETGPQHKCFFQNPFGKGVPISGSCKRFASQRALNTFLLLTTRFSLFHAQRHGPEAQRMPPQSCGSLLLPVSVLHFYHDFPLYPVMIPIQKRRGNVFKPIDRSNIRLDLVLIDERENVRHGAGVHNDTLTKKIRVTLWTLGLVGVARFELAAS